MLGRVVPLCLVAVLAACGGSDPATPVAAPASTATAATPTTASSAEATDSSAPPVVPAALQFSAPLVGGGDIELGALAGRPVLLWFWAPW